MVDLVFELTPPKHENHLAQLSPDSFISHQDILSPLKRRYPLHKLNDCDCYPNRKLATVLFCYIKKESKPSQHITLRS